MQNNKRLFLDIHLIQTVPPSNINRDDTGAPKSAIYGGARRARVSSQAWKRALRTYFNEHSEEENIGVRSKDLLRYVAKKVCEQSPEISSEDALEKVETLFKNAKLGVKEHMLKALFFLSENQAQHLATLAISGENDKNRILAAFNQEQAADIALFGRMVADNPEMNVDASSQVAHAISTHAVQTEYDYFTALDDLAPEDKAGAAMIDTNEFNSSTLYRYANVALHDLFNHLDNHDQFLNTAKLFVEAFALSMPTGKANTFANQSLPQAILVVLREDRPVNLVSAFEVPVKSKEGYVSKSIEKLTSEFDRANKFSKRPLAYWTVGDFTMEGNDSHDCDTVFILAEKLRDALASYFTA